MANMRNRYFVTVAALLSLVTWAYLPGLSGGFLFDDFGNLPALGQTGPVTTWGAFLRYITSGVADPTGRPLAMLTFLLDAHDWPAAPFPFKRTNLIIHLVNAGLLGALTYRLTRLSPALAASEAYQRDRAAIWIAATSTGMWAAHPLFVSTTLYIVQREAMLPCITILIGLHAWLSGRRKIALGQERSGAALILVSVPLSTLLGVLCKANGALLPVLILALEYTILNSWQQLSPKPDRINRYVLLVAGWLPAALIISYLVYVGISGIASEHALDRPWTIAQRLQTEPRVIVDYLRLIWFPRPYTPGVFNDQIGASTAWFHPVTTMPALVFCLALLVLALKQKNKWPVFSCAILFYFSGQLIESTSIPLELYFEHRNYLPAMLMFWPICYFVLGQRLTSFWGSAAFINRIARITSVAFVLLLALMTRANATIWGDTRHQADLWADLNPLSPRAQVNAANVELAQGNSAAAIERLQPILRTHPQDLQLALNLEGAYCAAGNVPNKVLEQTTYAMKTAANPGALLSTWFDQALPMATSKSCQGISVDYLDKLADAGLANPLMPYGRKQDLLHSKGTIALASSDPAAALQYFNNALAHDVRIDFALQQAALLGQNGYPHAGLLHLDYYAKIEPKARDISFNMAGLHDLVLRRQNYWGNELEYLRATLTQDAHAAEGKLK